MALHKITSDRTIKVAKPEAGKKFTRLDDGEGLYLLITQDGAKRWRFDYSFNRKRKTLSLGVYPDVPLNAARKRAAESRELVAAGTDPSDLRKAAKQQLAKRIEEDRRLEAGLPADGSFEAIAREWAAIPSDKRTETQTDRIIGFFEKDVFPFIGRLPIKEPSAGNPASKNTIDASLILETVQRVVDRGAFDIARRILFNIGRIFRYAEVKKYSQGDPTRGLSEFLPSQKIKHHAAVTTPEEIGGLLRAIDAYQGGFITKCALRLSPLLFVRPGELRNAEWAEINLLKGEWNIPGEKMKMRLPHLVPLATQAVTILQELHQLTGTGRYLFPGARTASRPMSNNSVVAALRRMGYSRDEMTGHGFRAMARTVLDEVLGVRPDFIEHQLAHAVRDPNGRAYNRTAHLAERRKMMQQWGDYLDKLKAGAEVIPLRANSAPS